MKKKQLVYLLIFFITHSFLWGQETPITIADPNFENYLETHDANGNAVNMGDASSMGDQIANNKTVFLENITDVTSLNVDNQNISSLEGIASFSSLETLICSNNNLTNLVVSSNVNLKSLLCGINQLPVLDIKQNNALEVLDCSGNQLEELVLQEGNTAFNPSLRRLTCSDNRLSNIDVSKNDKLTFLAVSNNQLTGELVVGNNTNLESLIFDSNNISTLNLINNTVLKTLNAANNVLISLDLTAINTKACPDPQTSPLTICQGGASINVSKNKLTSLNLANGNNNLIASFSSEENLDLFCIQTDAGFTAPNSWKKDDWTYYGDTTCTDIYTYVPDDNFEAYLEANNFGDGIANNNFVITAKINTETLLDVSAKNIKDLTGVQDFIGLVNLNCSNNNLTTLDLTNNTNLTSLNCSNNILPNLDLNTNILLESVNCASQRPYVDTTDSANNYTFTSLKINVNINLQTLDCSLNNLDKLEITNNIALVNLNCSSNKITNLDLSNNKMLSEVKCSNNELLALNVSNTTNVSTLASFEALNNPNLSCIIVDNVMFSDGNANWKKDVTAKFKITCGIYVPDNNFEQALIDQGIDTDGVLNNYVAESDVNTLTTLVVSGLEIEDLTGIEGFLALQDLDCSNNNLPNLDISSNTNLQTLNCASNKIENIDIALNTNLTTFILNDNLLLNLNVKNNATLTNLNVLNNANLFCIEVSNVANAEAITKNDDSPAGTWIKDNQAAYNEDCNGARFTDIPDDNFEQALIDLGLDTGPLDDRVLTSNIEHVLSLNVSDKEILTLEGIKGFASLKSLDCSNNYLNALNVSDMSNLEELYCSSNYFLTNNVSNLNGVLNTLRTNNLKKLFCSGNNLGDLDVSSHINLEELDCSDNKIIELEITTNTLLKDLNCSNNSLERLDISKNAIIIAVNADSNAMKNITTSAVNNSTLTNLSCANNTLSSLIIDNYLGLTDLNCGSNNLTELKTSNNSLLEFLDFTNNKVTTEGVNLSSNANLKTLLASQNQLEALNVTSNILLENLNCDKNKISELFTNTAPSLKYLVCSNNQLTAIDVSANFKLIELNTSFNNLSKLILSNNLNQLKVLNCSNNKIEGSLDLSTMGLGSCASNDSEDFCPENININVLNNQLEFVNISNGINNDILNFNATSNPNLNCIQVDNENNIGPSWQKDTTASYSTNCRFGETYVPDDNFENYLETHNADGGVVNIGDPLSMGDGIANNDYVTTASIETVTTLNIQGNTIEDLTGIENFKALQSLNCSNNNLSVVDVSKNSDLKEIDCSKNALSTLNFNDNLELTSLNCSNNTLSELDLASNINLVSLNISNNNFSTFNPGAISKLQVFNCNSNQLINLDLSLNASLTNLSCLSNQLEFLSVKNGQNPILLNLNAKNNPNLSCVQTDTGNVPAGAVWVKDDTAQYAIDCHFGETYVPDDAFETALQGLGYDSDDLDDYVKTSNIDKIEFLDIKEKNISDLTGIEGFESLKIFNFSKNNIVNVDLSKNVLLEDLNASSNKIEQIDISSLSNLKTLNISVNKLTQIAVGSNLSLTQLDVSNNSLNILDVNLNINLEILNCASNQLEALSVKSNTKLTELFCQKNLFIQDKLNLQNGANSKLLKFSAINNPGLKCVLVDDPFTVVSNVDNAYDNWFIDSTANYQSICADADNDGIDNADDMCPNTPFGDTVDLFGCSLLGLTHDNFKISVTDETCLNNNNGKIHISTLELYNYKANLKSDIFNRDYNFTNEIEVRNLLAGTYKLCITLEKWPNFKRCYDIVINHPKNLEVITKKEIVGKKIIFDVLGGSNYNIEFNGFKYSTSNPQLFFNLEKGHNYIKISTDLECQGIFEKNIFVSDALIVYPNPFKNEVIIEGMGKQEKSEIHIFSYLGELLYSKNSVTSDNTSRFKINTSNFSLGFYTVVVKSKSGVSTFKVVKK